MKKLGYDYYGFTPLDDDEKICHWPDCNHEFENGDEVEIELENGREGIYCSEHCYKTPFSENYEIIEESEETKWNLKI